MRRRAVPLLALTGSVAVHLGASALVLYLVAPVSIPQQSTEHSQLAMSTLTVKGGRAEERAPAAQVANAASARGGQGKNGAVPLTRAQSQPATGQLQQASRPKPDTIEALRNSGDPVVSLQDKGPLLSNAAHQAPTVSATVQDSGPVLTSAAHDALVVSATDWPEHVAVSEIDPEAALIGASTPTLSAKQSSPSAGDRLAAKPTFGPVNDAIHDRTVLVAASTPAATKVSAGHAWTGSGDVKLDAQSINTLAAFLQPGSGNARDVRDQMAQIMAAPACARVFTAFDRQTGELELRGHVPAPEIRAPLLAAMQAQIGGGLVLRDATHILPAPQCKTLDGIAALGLPQSEEQLTDFDLVGENAQVREYAFTEGDRLTIDLTGPDYPAYVYVDYFDAEGQVVHLRPNVQAPLEKVGASQVFSIGRGDDLDLRIAAPFGQDIAVAFATSEPLYEGLRPMIEPADVYLGALRKIVIAKSQSNPEFRGEWAYLFVATTPLSE